MGRQGRGGRGTIVRVGAFVVLALLMSACIKLDMNMTVSSDNTVSGTVIFALNKQLIQLSGQSPDSILGSVAPVPSNVQGVTAKPYEDDEFQGQQYTFDSVPLAQFNQGDSEDSLRIQREGDTFVVTGALDLSSASGASGASGVSGFPGADQIFKSAQLKITLTFPGPVKDANGQVNGNTVTWVPKVGERNDLHATASAIDSGGGSTLMILLIVAAVVVVIAIVAGVMVSRRRQPPAEAVGVGPIDAAAVSPPAAGPIDTGAAPSAPPDAGPVETGAAPATPPPTATPPPASEPPPAAPPGDTPPPPPPPSEPQP